MTKCPAGHDLASCSCVPAQDQIDAAAVAAGTPVWYPAGQKPPELPRHPGDQYANLVARVAALERWTASLLSPAMLQNRVHELEQRLDLHVSAQKNVHGLSYGATADRIAAIEERLESKTDLLRKLLTPSPSPEEWRSRALKWRKQTPKAEYEAELKKASDVAFSVLETYRKRAEKAEGDLTECRLLLQNIIREKDVEESTTQPLVEAAEWLRKEAKP